MNPFALVGAPPTIASRDLLVEVGRSLQDWLGDFAMRVDIDTEAGTADFRLANEPNHPTIARLQFAQGDTPNDRWTCSLAVAKPRQLTAIGVLLTLLEQFQVSAHAAGYAPKLVNGAADPDKLIRGEDVEPVELWIEGEPKLTVFFKPDGQRDHNCAPIEALLEMAEQAEHKRAMDMAHPVHHGLQ